MTIDVAQAVQPQAVQHQCLCAGRCCVGKNPDTSGDTYPCVFTMENQTLNMALARFSAYLADKGMRVSVERTALLEEIYSRTDHFTIEELYESMQVKNFRVSLSTIYNNLELLLACGLVRKHHFGRNATRYEKSLHTRQHHHLVCLTCQRIVEFCDPRLGHIQQMAETLLEFEVVRHELVFYGYCRKAGCPHQAGIPKE